MPHATGWNDTINAPVLSLIHLRTYQSDPHANYIITNTFVPIIHNTHHPSTHPLTLVFHSTISIINLTGTSSFTGRTITAAANGSSLSMMRHRKKLAKLGKPADQRKALLRALTTEVIRHGRIKTTLVRAKAVRKHVDHMIQLGKRGDLHARRQALGWMYDKDLVHSLFEAAPERYAEREGGYTRVLRTMPRQGDNAKMAVIELV